MGEFLKGIEMAGHVLDPFLPELAPLAGDGLSSMAPEIIPRLAPVAPEGLSAALHTTEPAVSAATEPAVNAAVRSAAPEAGVIADGTVTARSGAAKVINYNGVAPKTLVENLIRHLSLSSALEKNHNLHDPFLPWMTPTTLMQ